MSRLIDADALREQLVWCKEQAGRYNDYWDDVIERLDSLPTIGGWISVKDRLPKGEDDYLVIQHAHKPTVTLAWYSGDENGWQAIDGSFYADGIVTHYMPLPEPPKEEKDDA